MNYPSQRQENELSGLQRRLDEPSPRALNGHKWRKQKNLDHQSHRPTGPRRPPRPLLLAVLRLRPEVLPRESRLHLCPGARGQGGLARRHSVPRQRGADQQDKVGFWLWFCYVFM